VLVVLQVDFDGFGSVMPALRQAQDRLRLASREIQHWQHAAMENAIKEHKSGFGLEKLPTQKFHANWA
jgi:hypothetical protein